MVRWWSEGTKYFATEIRKN